MSQQFGFAERIAHSPNCGHHRSANVEIWWNSIGCSSAFNGHRWIAVFLLDCLTFLLPCSFRCLLALVLVAWKNVGAHHEWGVTVKTMKREIATMLWKEEGAGKVDEFTIYLWGRRREAHLSSLAHRTALGAADDAAATAGSCHWQQ